VQTAQLYLKSRYGESTTKDDTDGGGTTQGYAPPRNEQLQTPTTKWDVFSFGVIVNEIYSKAPPFYSEPGVSFKWDQEKGEMNARLVGGLSLPELRSLQFYQTDKRPKFGSFPFKVICPGNPNGSDIKEIVVQCWSGKQTERPAMADVVKMLNGSK